MGYLQRVVVAVQPLKAPQQTAKRVWVRETKKGGIRRGNIEMPNVHLQVGGVGASAVPRGLLRASASL